MEKGSVCVTGGTGFLASWLIKRLLEQGYSVNTTVRSSKKNVSYLTDLPGASERLKIFEADLSKPDTFKAPIQGCIGVFHVAHPIDFVGKEPEEVITERAIKGGLGILQACLDSKTVKKVVYTSSASAVVFNGKKYNEVLDEESWSDVDYIRTHFNDFGGAPYFISKTLTEKALLKFAEEKGLDFVNVIPTYIHGPFVGPNCPGSVHVSMAMIFGDTSVYNMLMKTDFVHVDDVARAHIHLLEYQNNAKGRYICSKVVVTLQELYRFLSVRYPEYKIPNIDFLKDVEEMKFPGVSSEKLLSTGFRFKHGLEEMFDDAIACSPNWNQINQGIEKGSVCVTGGTGYLASWLIKSLLQHGYLVNTTIRSTSGSRKDVSYLADLPGASERLKIFEADLSKPDTFKAPIQGSIGVFHVAHPIDFVGKEPEEVITERAIKGGLGILQACLDSKTVKKVVYTSSASAVVLNGKKYTEVLDEEYWSDVDFIRAHYKDFGAPYFISKTLTEKALLKFAEEKGLDVVTVIPTYIHGPFVGPRCPGSVHVSMAMIFGDTSMYKMLMKMDFVHVDDVARAHIHLLEYPYAKGRYICSKVGVTIEDLYKFLSTRYPKYNIPNFDIVKDVDKMKFPGVSSRKLLDSGFKFKYGLEEMFDDAIDSCKRNNIL